MVASVAVLTAPARRPVLVAPSPVAALKVLRPSAPSPVSRYGVALPASAVRPVGVVFAALPSAAEVLASSPGVRGFLRPSSRSLSGWVLAVCGPASVVCPVARAWAMRLPFRCGGVVVRRGGRVASVPVHL